MSISEDAVHSPLQPKNGQRTPSNAAAADGPADTVTAHAGDGDEKLTRFTHPPTEPHAPTAIPDPVSELDAYKSPHQIEIAARPPARIASLQIRKPNDQEYVRVMPGNDRILPLFRSKANGDKLYLYKREAEPYLPAKAIRPYRLVLAKSLRALVPFIWPLPVPLDDMGRTWHESGDSAAREAEGGWIKVVADIEGGCYVTYQPGAELPEPEWPSESLSDLILMAFRNQRIDGPDHPLIRRLNGEFI